MSTKAGQLQTFTYDRVGNRLTEAIHLGTSTYAYDAADRLTSVTPPGGPSVAYTYDANGNQTSAGSSTYAWDLADRLASASVGPTTETYSYAGDGVRLSASRGPGATDTTRFVVDRNVTLPQVAQERDGGGALVRSYTFGHALISQMSPNDPTSYLHHDGLGSITDLTSTNGTLLGWTDYEPFGVPRSAGAVANSPTTPFGFTGQYLDDASGLHHFRARQYDPGTGRFLARDPQAPSIEDPLVASYAYARNRPAVLVDPSGLDSAGLCISVQAGFIFFAGEQFCLLVTGEGELGITGTTEYGIGTPSASATAGVHHSNVPSIEDLAGPFGFVGGSAGQGIVGGFETFTGSDRCGNPVFGGNAAAGVGVGPFYEGHGGQSQTDVLLNMDLGGLLGDKDEPCRPPNK